LFWPHGAHAGQAQPQGKTKSKPSRMRRWQVVMTGHLVLVLVLALVLALVIFILPVVRWCWRQALGFI
jgi:hypothetical protein